MTRYSKIACTILFAAVTSTTISIAPWIHPTPATETQAL